MNKSDNHALREKLLNKLIKIIAPKGMSAYEYRVQCNLNGVEASIEDGPFLYWLITNACRPNENTIIVNKSIIHAINQKYLLDFDNEKQCAYFCDAIRDSLMDDKWWTEKLLEAVLKNYKSFPGYGKDVFDFCKRLNKAFGLTSVEYFR
ncbi:MAG: hypothetical protein J6W16_01965 [Methanobrevibacter sp.]|nr:hypothetical protein [Methanobrevibacter sp.]